MIGKRENGMFRTATREDIEQITTIYDHIHDAEEAGDAVVGWVRQVYPTRQTAVKGVSCGDMFVEAEDGVIVAAGRINQQQVEEYKNCHWLYQVPDCEVMVLHTLVVDYQRKGKGYGSAFVKFYEEYALSQNCRYLRIDTQEKNTAARTFYGQHGFREVGVTPCNFNGIPEVQLVCLEKALSVVIER